MFGNGIRKSSHPVPEWAKDIFYFHLDPSWKLVWHVVKPRHNWSSYGCCYSDSKVIECFISHNEQLTRNEYLLLHEIAHAKRGHIPTPSHRINRIAHDEKFFRIAASLYIDYDLSVLKFAVDHEYVSGRYIMAGALRDPKEFMKNPLSYPIYRQVRRQALPKADPVIPSNSCAWFVRRTGEVKVGKIIRCLRKRYRFQSNDGEFWDVPFHLMNLGSPVEKSRQTLLTLQEA